MAMRDAMRTAALAAALAACTLPEDDEPTPGGGPVTIEQATAGCRRQCEHDLACRGGDPSEVEVCAADCATEVSGWVGVHAFGPIIECIVAVPCDQSTEQCIAACVPTATHEGYEARCRRVFAGCGAVLDVDSTCEVTPMPGSSTGFLCLAAASIIQEMSACIPDGIACEPGRACIEDVRSRHGLNF